MYIRTTKKRREHRGEAPKGGSYPKSYIAWQGVPSRRLHSPLRSTYGMSHFVEKEPTNPLPGTHVTYTSARSKLKGCVHSNDTFFDSRTQFHRPPLLYPFADHLLYVTLLVLQVHHHLCRKKKTCVSKRVLCQTGLSNISHYSERTAEPSVE